MNRACFAVDTDRIGCETALPVLVLGCVVNRACFELILMESVVKLL